MGQQKQWVLTAKSGRLSIYHFGERSLMKLQLLAHPA